MPKARRRSRRAAATCSSGSRFRRWPPTRASSGPRSAAPQARLENAKAAQARAHDLFDRGVAARKEVEDADRELADAEADLGAGAGARCAAADAWRRAPTVRATFDGIVARRPHNPGDLVEPTASDRGAARHRSAPSRGDRLGADRRRLARHDRRGRAARGGARRRAVGAEVASRPAAVEPGHRRRCRSVWHSWRRRRSPSARPVEVEIDAEEHTDVVLVPPIAIVREGDETAVFVAVGDKAAAAAASRSASPTAARSRCGRA